MLKFLCPIALRPHKKTQIPNMSSKIKQMIEETKAKKKNTHQKIMIQKEKFSSNIKIRGVRGELFGDREL